MAGKGKVGGSRRSARASGSPLPAPEAGGEPALSLDRIVATAVTVLDAKGIDGLTMRGLAGSLGAGAMSLYWHVASKEVVFDLALDAVLEYRGAPAAEGPDWRGDVVGMLHDWRAAMLRHPWSAALLPRRALGQNMLMRLELLGRTLSRAGVDDADLNVAIWALWNYVMGATVTLGNFERSADENSAAQERLAGLGERHPTIERSRLLLDSDWDGAFRKGLNFLLDGLAPAGKKAPGQ